MSEIDIDDIRHRARQEPDYAKRAEMLGEAARTILRIDPNGALELLNLAITAAKRGRCTSLIALNLRSRGACMLVLGRLDEARENLHKSVQLYRSINDQPGLAQAMGTLGALYMECGENNEAVRVLNEALEMFRQLGEPFRCVITMSTLGGACFTLGDYTTAQSILFDTIRLCQEHGYRHEEGECYSALAHIYEALGENLRARDYLLKTIEYAERKETPGMAIVLANLGMNFCNGGEYEMAERYLLQALDLGNRLCYRRSVEAALTFLGRLYQQKGELPKALDYALAAVTISEEIGDRTGLSETLFMLAGILHRMGDSQAAIDHLQRALTLFETATAPPIEYDVCHLLAEIYESIGDAPQALTYYKRYMAVRNEIEGRETKKTIAEMQARFDLERAEKEREIAQLRSAQLEAEINHTTRELSAMSLSLKRRSDLLDDLKGQIQRGLNAVGRERWVLKGLQAHIEAQEQEQYNYDAFTSEVNRIQQEFNRQLAQRYPLLTAAELRICSLLRGNLTTKEIADLLHVTARNIETHRYHIRKKMQLPSDINLTTFLAGL